MRAILLAVITLAAAPVRAEQLCDTKTYPLSTPTSRFADHGDGTVTDTQSGITWMRCAIGQSWTGKACDGQPTALSWQGAQDVAASLDQHNGYAGHTDWRMPRIPELAMIAERQCADPRINLEIFPGTPADIFWTASQRRGAGNEGQAYYLSFGKEGTGGADKAALHFARLMRPPPKP